MPIPTLDEMTAAGRQLGFCLDGGYLIYALPCNGGFDAAILERGQVEVFCLDETYLHFVSLPAAEAWLAAEYARDPAGSIFTPLGQAPAFRPAI